MLGTGRMLIGAGKLINPAKVVKLWVSPRKRAQRTYQLLFENSLDSMDTKTELQCESLAKWGYGAYEGLLTKGTRERRKGQGLDQEGPWDIWIDGCEEGE